MFPAIWHVGAGLIVLFMLGSIARADTCGEIKSYKDIIDCAALRAPAIRRSGIELKVAESEMDRAGQIPNPELENRSLWNSQSGQGSGVATETQLLFPLQLGGKRSARQQVAKTQKDSVAALAQSARETILIETAQALHRLRQLETELDLANEAIERFGRIISAFRRRPQLNPEQSVSLTTFRYALEEEKQKRSQVLAERSSLLTDLSLALGQKIEAKKEFLPKVPGKWPTLPAAQLSDPAEVKFARSKQQEAKAQSLLAKSEAWPDLKIGPSYERMPDRERTEERVGFGLSVELPLFNRNRAGKKSAEFSQALATMDAEQTARAAQARLESLVEQYSVITEALASAPSQAELEKGHRGFENQFKRGLVPYSLIIEAHRQLHDTVETKHKQELTALNLLWSIYRLTGRLKPEAL